MMRSWTRIIAGVVLVAATGITVGLVGGSKASAIAVPYIRAYAVTSDGTVVYNDLDSSQPSTTIAAPASRLRAPVAGIAIAGQSFVNVGGPQYVGNQNPPGCCEFWLAAADGGVFAEGGAPFLGSMADRHLNEPVVGIAATPSGHGFWLVAADGGVFGFGDAGYYGSAADLRLNRPVIGIAPTEDGRGYWLAAADGGVFSFGDARFYGNAQGFRLAQPIVAINGQQNGYYLLGRDGGVFTFGGAKYFGSVAGTSTNPAIGLLTYFKTASTFYYVVRSDGSVVACGPTANGVSCDANQGTLKPVPAPLAAVTGQDRISNF